MKKNNYFFLKLLGFFIILVYTNLQSQNLVQTNFNSLILPKYSGSGSSTRLPMVFRASVTGLTPNSTYRFYNFMAQKSDFGTTSSGAGNPMFIGSTFIYTTNPGLSTAGNYGEFATDFSGNYTGWFCVVYTSNSRFTAGKYLYPTITLNNGSGGTAATARYALNDSVLVTSFSTSSGSLNVTGIYGISMAVPKNIILLYDNINGTGRPLSATYVESEDTTVSGSVAFYTANVNSVKGAWGTLIPNNNISGIRRIEQRSLNTAVLVGCATDDDGIWPTNNVNTINPAGGATALSVSISDAPLTDCNPSVAIFSDSTVNSNVSQGSTNVILYKINMYPNILGTILDSLQIKISGSYNTKDFLSNGFKLWYSKDAFLDTSDVFIDSVSANPVKSVFFKNPFSMVVHKTAHLIITSDISPAAKPCDTFYTEGLDFANIFLHSGIKNGNDPLPQGGVKKIIFLNNPQIKADTPGTFGKVVVFSSSKEAYFHLDGNFLYPADDSLTIIPPQGFEVSNTSGSGFSSLPIKVPYSSGKISTKIYTRFNPTVFKFYSENIKITGNYVCAIVPVCGTGISPDTVSPEVDTAFAIDCSTIMAIFSEAVDSTTYIPANYTGLGAINKITKSADLDTVILYLSKTLNPGVSEILTIKNIRDTCSNHNIMTAPKSFSISYGTLPAIPTYKIYQVKKIDSMGIADSLNVYCRLTGNVISLNCRPAGYEFIIHDGTSGICVYKTANIFRNYKNPETGDLIGVTGIISQSDGMIRIIPDSIIKTDSDQLLPTPVIVMHLTDWSESELVRINDLKLIDTINYPWPKSADSSMTVKASNGHDTFMIHIETECRLHGKYGTAAPANIFDIIGVGWQSDSSVPFSSEYLLYPRFVSDLILHTTGIFRTSIKNPISIFPNPCRDALIIESKTGEILCLKIFNSIGKMIHEQYINGKIVNLKTGFSPGLYFLRIENVFDKEVYFEKIVIK